MRTVVGAHCDAGDFVVIEREGLEELSTVLRADGYKLVGPRVRDGAIVYDEITGAGDLPVGWTDEQDGGRYRLHKRNDDAFFGYAVGPHSWKKFLFPPVVRLLEATRRGSDFEVKRSNDTAPKLAFVGVRACELHAIATQDKVFMGGAFVDPIYAARRRNTFLVAVNCGHPAGTCFCVSMNTGPQATGGFDLALTEIIESLRHYFVVEIGSPAGARVMDQVEHSVVTEAEREAARGVVARAAGMMGRAMDTDGIKELLYRNYEHPRWDDVAGRCLTCANCTMVCPTCFCSTVEDVTDLQGEHAERWRKWDSCFTMNFSHVVGGSARHSAKSRYRQWMTHKLATWIDQFGTSGCVGCGRCITWCPVGIDITEEVRAIRESENAGATQREDMSHARS
ncbi:MAG TPA: 4Fe-4S dicluster domain-containing protein [Terrimicrobiaceae bacterium]